MRFLADENFNDDIATGLLRRLPHLDLVRAVEAGLGGAGDPALLAWAAGEGRVVLTHDVQTLPNFAYARVAAGLPMPGVVEVPDGVSLRVAIDELEMMATASSPGEWEGQVVYLPL